MPRKSSYAVADGDVQVPKLNNRSKKQFKRAPLPLNKLHEAFDSLSSHSDSHNPPVRRSMLAVYGTRTDKKVTDPRRRNKKRQLKARQFDHLYKLDEQMDELYALQYQPSSYRYLDVMHREEVPEEVPEEALCGTVESVEAPTAEVSAKIDGDDALNEVAAEKPLLRLRRSRSLVVSKVDHTDEKEESSDTSFLYKMSEVSSEDGWTMA